MWKKIISILLAGTLLLGVAGCKNTGDEKGEDKEVVLTGEMVPVASFSEVNLTMSEFSDYAWEGDKFIYLNNEWWSEEEMLKSTLCRVSATGNEEPEVLYENQVGEPSLIRFTIDEDGNMYWLERFYHDGNENHYQVRKMNANLQEQYCYTLDENEFELEGFLVYVNDLEVDHNGNLILTDSNNHVYFLDAEGNYLGKDDLGLTDIDNFVDAKELGCYFCENTAGEQIALQRIDFERGKLDSYTYIDMSDFVGTTENCKLLGGNENGFLISSTNKLWQYHVRTEETEELLNWLDGNISIDGYDVEKIIFTEPYMKVLCYDYATDKYEIAEISYVDKAYVKERETIVLGAAHSFAVKPWVKKFNRSNKDYVVVIKEYENITQFTDVLLYNREEIPDLLDISWSSTKMLNSKNLLVDLEPYFKESEVVGKEDLMEQVWEAGCYQGVLTSIMNGFSFQTCLTTADTLSEDGWTYEDFFALEDAYPESRPLQTYTEIGVWKFLQTAGVNDYVDWESRTCSFTSPEFEELLTQLKELAYVTAEQSRVEYETDTAQQFLSGEFLIQTGNYGSPYFIKSMLKEYNGKVKNVGYPTKDGSPCYLMNPKMQLGIYSQSENKDGAWAFIEYLLSAEGQDWYGAENNDFPVRKEAFETYLSRSYSRTRGDGEYDKYITETKKIIQKMLKYAQPQTDGDAGKITEIIYEELQAYFADTRTAKETADIIQSRVQLYLDETF